MSIGDYVYMLSSKYGLYQGQRCKVTGQSRDQRSWKVESGQQVLQAHEGSTWEWRECDRHVDYWLDLAPTQIGFTQDSIATHFKDGRSLQSVLGYQLGSRKRRRGNECTIADSEVIQVIFVNGHYYSLNNRLLAVHRLLEIKGAVDVIKVNVVAFPNDSASKFTTRCDGDWVQLRGCEEWIGRTAAETNCWAQRATQEDLDCLKQTSGTHVRMLENDDLGIVEEGWSEHVAVRFDGGVQQCSLDEIDVTRQMYSKAHKLNWFYCAREIGVLLCTNQCLCGCGVVCAGFVCVCPCCNNPYHNDGRYCDDCAESMGLDLALACDHGDHVHSAAYEDSD